MRNRSRVSAVAVLAVLLAGVSPAGANADPGATNEQALAVAEGVFSSFDPQAAASELSAFEVDLLMQGMTLAAETVAVTVSPVSEVVAREAFIAGGQHAAAAASYDACFSREAAGAGKNLLGGVLYDYYTTLYYCSKGGKIATAKWTRQTGQVRFPGWYYDGKVTDQIDFSARNIGGFTQFKFHAGPVSQLPIQNAYPCLRTRVNSSGGVSTSSSCSV